MWLITTFGFFSIVSKRGDETSGRLTVRSRSAADLDALRATFLPTLGPTTANAGTDYKYRATAPKADVAKAVAEAVARINYANFKNAVGERQGRTREAVYHKVWDALFQIEDRTGLKS